MSHSVLIIDDDASVREPLTDALARRELTASWTTQPEQAEALLRARPFDVVLADVRLPQQDGVELCARLVGSFPGLPVVVMSGAGDVDTAVAAMRAGASDFLTKPISIELLSLSLTRAIGHARLRRELAELQRLARTRCGELVGASHAMRAVYEMLERAAPSEASVLIYGEPGTGKELLARTLAAGSPREAGPFVAVNCAAASEALLDSELFGSPGDSPATSHAPGALARAARGSLFLDEVSELPLPLQAKLLRVLQERRLRAVGSEQEAPLDVRLICTTSRDLERAVAERRFRADLYYRINVIQVALPRLALRGDDVLLLARHFLERFERARAGGPLRLTPEFEALLQAYAWPGNVRELSNCMQRAALLARGRELGPLDLPDNIRNYRQAPLGGGSEPHELVALDEVERRYILHVLDAVHGNKSRAAQVLGLDRKTLYRRLERYGVVGEETRAEPAPS